MGIDLSNIKTIISIVLFVINFCVTCILTIKNIINAIKNKKIRNIEELKVEMKKNIIPLMEQAERSFDNPQDKENWVIKKLSDMTHIDFYKYKNILIIAKNIIKEICETTKIEVNKTIIVKEKEEEKQSTEVLTNGIS